MSYYDLPEETRKKMNWHRGLLGKNEEDLNKNRKWIDNKGIIKSNKDGKTNIPYICSECGCKGEWNGKKVTLELHHIDGNHFNNDPGNLTFLCPNCHSQTINFRYRGKHHKSKYTNIKKAIIDYIEKYDQDIERFIKEFGYPHKNKVYKAYIELLKDGVIIINDKTETSKRLLAFKPITKVIYKVKKEKVIVKQVVSKIKNDPNSWIKKLTIAEKKIWFDIVSKKFTLNRDDPNYVSKALQEIEKECERQRNSIKTWIGRHHSEDTKLILSLKNKKILKGETNYMTGKCWICNDSTKETKIIKKEDIQKYINLGWRKGRFIKID